MHGTKGNTEKKRNSLNKERTEEANNTKEEGQDEGEQEDSKAMRIKLLSGHRSIALPTAIPEICASGMNWFNMQGLEKSPPHF